MLVIILGSAILFALLRSILPRLAFIYAQSTMPKQANTAADVAAINARARQLSGQITTVLWIAEAVLQYSFSFFKRNLTVIHFQEGTVPGFLTTLLSLNQGAALFYASGVVIKQVQSIAGLI